MKTRAVLFGMSILVALLIIPSVAKANVSNQATQVTFQMPVRIPGTVLPSGTYWFTVVNAGPAGGLDRVLVSDANGKPIAQMTTQTVDHAEFGQRGVTASGITFPTGKVVMTFAEGTNGQPLTLVNWYYAGRTDGHQFVYSSQRERQLTEENHQTVSFATGDKLGIIFGRSLAAFE